MHERSRDVLEHADQVHFLLVVAADYVARLLPHDRQHRHVVESCVIESGDEVRSARTRGREAHAKLTREFRVGARHEGGHFLVPRLHERNLVASAIERAKDAIDAVTGIPEYPSDSPRVEALDHEIADGLAHPLSPGSGGIS